MIKSDPTLGGNQLLSYVGIHEAIALYRVSTRAQERKGESLLNQERSVRAWAQANDIRILREIKVTESGKSALRLVGAGFQFSRRAEYTKLLVELQEISEAERPQAIVIDWIDRWSRNTLEYVGIIKAFRELGIRLIAIGDGRELTDPRYEMELQIRAAIAEEQLRITSGKIKEHRRSRRDRSLWQGGAAPDGYRTHAPDCAGLTMVERDGADGQTKRFSVRSCTCPQTVLRRDPKRAPTIAYIWKKLETSPLSWEGMTAEVNDAGFRTMHGKRWRWNDLYRIGENPHYAGILATDRWERDPYDGRIKRRKALRDQNLVLSPESIPEPFISEQTFWDLYERRFNKQTRSLQRSGPCSELSGVLRCPNCGDLMSSFYQLSPKTTGHGNPRRAPRRKYVYMDCPNAVRRSGREITCANSRRVRVNSLSRMLIEHLARIARLSDDSITEAIKLQKRENDGSMLETERRELLATVSTSDESRHILLRALSAGHITQDEFEREIFAFRSEKNAAAARLREIERLLSQSYAKPDFEAARNTIVWLAERWERLTVPERSEALRLLVDAVTYARGAGVHAKDIEILAYGRAFSENQRATPRAVPQPKLVDLRTR
jgi:DNA invertase Pin-like site-specific DNA recombinase